MHIHILGICGTFMGGIAALARQAGHTVTGCDSGVYPPMSDQLRALGIELIEGYEIDQLTRLPSKPDIFVIGNAISRTRLQNGKPKYPLMEAILDSGLPYTSGPQWLSENILQNCHVLAVAGTHGKTSTSSMLAWVLEKNNLKPGFLIGGVPQNFGISARLPQVAPDGKHYFVIEADEYDTAFFDKRSKFVHYRPRTAILNNLEFDHADIFDNLAAIERQFHHFVRTIPSTGHVIVNLQQASLQRVLDCGVYSQVIGFGATGQWQAKGAAHDFDVYFDETHQGHVQWSLQGVHNQMNALAVLAACHSLGLDSAVCAQYLGAFENVKRRMQIRARIDNGKGIVTVYDDFAHHPSAIATTLEGLQARLAYDAVQPWRIFAVVEPRTNTMRLGPMKEALAPSLQAADYIFAYSAGLDWNIQEALAPLGQRVFISDSLEELVQKIGQLAHENDHIVCMSNGSFGNVHDKIVQTLQRNT